MVQSMKRIMFSAGEVSGDLHGSNLALELKNRFGNNVELFGLGGQRMSNAGVKIIDDITTLSTIGFTEPISFILKKLRVGLKLKKLFKSEEIDLLILIDNQGFNIPLSKWAKDCNIKTMYFFPPPVSIWGHWNAKKLVKQVDTILCPFETDHSIYLNEGGCSLFVGHPFIDTVKTFKSKDDIRKELNIKSEKVVSLLPGSRTQEINNLLHTMLLASEILHKQYDLTFLIAISSQKFKERIVKEVSNFPDLKIIPIDKWNYDYLNISDFAITSSGTATLEIALLGIPMVILYQISSLTFTIGKKLVKAEHVGLPNLLYGDTVVPELLQKDMNVEEIVKQTSKFLDDKNYYDSTIRKLLSIKDKLGEPGVFSRICDIVEEVLFDEQSSRD